MSLKIPGDRKCQSINDAEAIGDIYIYIYIYILYIPYIYIYMEKSEIGLLPHTIKYNQV